MSEYKQENTSFHSQTCLTPGEQIVIQCLKFLSRNCRYHTASLSATAWLTSCQSVTCVKHGVMYVCLFVSKQYSLRQRIFTVKTYKRKKFMKSITSSLEYSSRVSQFLQYQQYNKWLTNIKSTVSLFSQQDGATVYITCHSLATLQNISGDQIISFMLWPAHLPSLTVCDYYL